MAFNKELPEETQYTVKTDIKVSVGDPGFQGTVYEQDKHFLLRIEKMRDEKDFPKGSRFLLEFYDFNEEFVDYNLKIQFNHNQQIKDKFNKMLGHPGSGGWQYTQTKSDANISSQESKCKCTAERKIPDYLKPSLLGKLLGATAEKTSQGVTWGLILINAGGFLMGKSMKALWQALDSLQAMFYLRYVNESLPWMLLQFIESFNLAVFNIGPQVLTKMFNSDKEYMATQKAPYGFRKEGFTTSFLINQEKVIWATGIMGVTCIALNLVVSLYKKCRGKAVYDPSKKPGFPFKQIIKYKENLEWNDLIKQVCIIYYRVTIFTFLQFYNISFNTQKSKINSILALWLGYAMWKFPDWVGKL